MADNKPTRQDAKANIIAKALRDEDYRKALCADPKAVVEQELGVKLPAGLNIEVVQETNDHAYLVRGPHLRRKRTSQARLRGRAGR